MQIVSQFPSSARTKECDAAVARASSWFQQVELCCNRFDETSELRRLCDHAGTPVYVSDLLFEAVQFAVAVADATNGAFDPTVGARMASLGFNRDYRDGRVTSFIGDVSATFRDIELNAATHCVMLHKPLLLDLGAVAKGLAIDMAARELQPLTDFMIDAGGDLYLGGHNESGELWSVGIKHPREPSKFVHTLHVSNVAVCTSGDYERVAPNGAHHLVNAATGEIASELASVTVTGPSAMVADALATAAFALGPQEGRTFLDSHGVAGLLITPSLEKLHTNGHRVD